VWDSYVSKSVRLVCGVDLCVLCGVDSCVMKTRLTRVRDT